MTAVVYCKRVKILRSLNGCNDWEAAKKLFTTPKSLAPIHSESAKRKGQARRASSFDSRASGASLPSPLGYVSDLWFFWPVASLQVRRLPSSRSQTARFRRDLPIVVAEDFLVKVAEQVERIVEPLESTADYLRTKREKMGHLLDR